MVSACLLEQTNDRQQFSAIVQTVLMGSLEYTGAQFAIA